MTNVRTQMTSHGRHLGTIAIILAFALCSGLRGEESVFYTSAADSSTQIEKFTTEELHTLVAPIALYPDALLAQILPASTFPIEIVEATRYTLTANTPDSPPSDSSWDSSVIALLHYPTVLKKLNDDLTWTDQLGTAVTYQMTDVSQAIQQVRAEAQAAGNLSSNDKQRIIVEHDIIQIVPADPQFIYVPTYDPYMVSNRYYNGSSLFSWGIGLGFGSWMSNDFDWRQHRIWRNNYWYRGDWHRQHNRTAWSAHHHSIPSWYQRHAGNRARLPGRTSGHENRHDSLPHHDRVRPRQTPEHNNPPANTPRHNNRSRRIDSHDSEGHRNSGHQTTREQSRGKNSLRGMINNLGIRQAPTHRTPRSITPRATTPRSTTPRTSTPDGYQRNSDGRTAQRESHRGSTSRGSRKGRH